MVPTSGRLSPYHDQFPFYPDIKQSIAAFLAQATGSDGGNLVRDVGWLVAILAGQRSREEISR